jgi:hypothetical protein
MIDKNILNDRDNLEYQETISLPAWQSKLNMEAAPKKRAQIRVALF